MILFLYLGYAVYVCFHKYNEGFNSVTLLDTAWRHGKQLQRMGSNLSLRNTDGSSTCLPSVTSKDTAWKLLLIKQHGERL